MTIYKQKNSGCKNNKPDALIILSIFILNESLMYLNVAQRKALSK